MIPKLQKRGSSFKETCRYVLHDVGTDTQDRVGWTATQNIVSHPDDAWFEMLQTANAQSRLKAANGVDARGRKNEKPVLHLSLSWAKEDAPTREHMQETALSCLKTLGLGGHEALIVGHSDKEHPHVHIVANTIHPYTGRTASLKFAKLELSRWAEAYEREHGIHCHQRLQNNDDRKVIGEQRSQEASGILMGIARGEAVDARAPYAPVRDTSPDRSTWMKEKALAALSADILRGLTRNNSTFSRQDLARAVSGKTDDAAGFAVLLAKIESSQELARLPGEAERLSTQTMVRTERAMMDAAETMASQSSHPVYRDALSEADIGKLSDGQRVALGHVLGSAQLAAVVGYAGSGKSTMLGEARKVWEAEGYTVRGAALSGIAAEGLEGGSGIRSSTIHALQWAWGEGTEKLGPMDVVVIDEAGMVGSRQMQAVIATVQKAGAKLVLVGDPQQLRPIEAGAAFRAIIEKTGAAEITEIVRQQVAWQREATKYLAMGGTAEAIDAYSRNGNVHSHEDRGAAIGAIVAAWARDTSKSHESKTLMLAATNAAVRELNSEARLVQKERGKLGRDIAFQAWDESIDRPRSEFTLAVAVGERLMFTKNDKRLDVKNGTLGTLLGIENGAARLLLDGRDPREVLVDLSQYRNFVHGYALTIHKSQGATADRVHVLAGRSMDRNLAYVAMSRHRQGLRLHYGLDDFASKEQLGAALGRDRIKDTTLDYSAPRERQTITKPLHKEDRSVVSRSFAESSKLTKPSERIRNQMQSFRGKNRGGDFGREL